MATASDSASAKRLVGLDVMRGITMAVMLVVDVAGDAYPSIGHASWDGLHLADFVMPYFLLICGISAALSPGTVFHLTEAGPLFVFDLATFRVMGILQRIAVVFLTVMAIDIYVPGIPGAGRSSVDVQLLSNRQPGEDRGYRSNMGLWLLTGSAWQWLVVLLIVGLGGLLTYGIKVPASWPGCSGKAFGPGNPQILQKMGCSSVGWLDSQVLGVHHVYIQGSTDGPSGAANFGFDPEGLVTTLSAVLPMFLGMHVARAGRLLKWPLEVIAHWAILGTFCMWIGACISPWLPFNKRLWSPSYSLLTSGSAILLYGLLYSLCDCWSKRPTFWGQAALCFSWLTSPFQWLGSNCIVFFVLSECCGVFSWFLQSLAWGQPAGEHNVVHWFRKQVLWNAFQCDAAPCGPDDMAYAIIGLAFWAINSGLDQDPVLVCGVLHRRGIFWKL